MRVNIMVLPPYRVRIKYVKVHLGEVIRAVPDTAKHYIMQTAAIREVAAWEEIRH